MKDDITRRIGLPSGVTANIAGTMLTIKGPKGEVQREFLHPKIAIMLQPIEKKEASGKTSTAVDKSSADKSSADKSKGDMDVVLFSKRATKREKKDLNSFAAHIRNTVKGVQAPHVYRLKICSGHFPMSVAVSGQEFVVKNFLGESVPRKFLLPKGVKVKVEGTEVMVESPDKEMAGLTASKIEQLCVIKGRDLRIFQDGCYIVHKAGKGI